MRTGFPFSNNTSEGLPALITIQRGIQTLRFTTLGSDVTIDTTTWVAGRGATLTNVQFPSDGSPANADITIQATAGSIVAPGDAARGVLDGWQITIELVDLGDPAFGTYSLIPNGIIGSVLEDNRGIVTIAVNGLLSLAQSPITEHYSLTCRADLGNDQCKIPILGDRTIAKFDIGRSIDFVRPDIATGLLQVGDAYGRISSDGSASGYGNVYFTCTSAGTTAATAPAYDYTVGNSTVDGTCTFQSCNAWLRYATGRVTDTYKIVLNSLPDARASDATWYVMGGLFVRSGALSGFPCIPIRAWDPGTLTLTTFLPVSATDIPAATQFEIYPGCDLTRDMCESRFSNIVNGRFETFVPPPDVKLAFGTIIPPAPPIVGASYG